jgi:hypothetical protein
MVSRSARLSAVAMSGPLRLCLFYRGQLVRTPPESHPYPLGYGAKSDAGKAMFLRCSEITISHNPKILSRALRSVPTWFILSDEPMKGTPDGSRGESRRLQTMAERPHYGRVTWFSGSAQHFRRFNQIRQPNGPGIGTRYGTAHKNTHQRVRYASKA